MSWMHEYSLVISHAALIFIVFNMLVLSAAFMVWMLVGLVQDELVRAEVGYLGATVVLCALLFVVYRAGAGVSPRAAR